MNTGNSQAGQDQRRPDRLVAGEVKSWLRERIAARDAKAEAEKPRGIVRRTTRSSGLVAARKPPAPRNHSHEETYHQRLPTTPAAPRASRQRQGSNHDDPLRGGGAVQACPPARARRQDGRRIPCRCDRTMSRINWTHDTHERLMNLASVMQSNYYERGEAEGSGGRGPPRASTPGLHLASSGAGKTVASS